MKLKMAENSLFAILLRKPWWMSILLSIVIALGLAALMPRHLAPYAMSGGVPFFIIGVVAAFRQRGAPSASAVANASERLRAMSWKEFADSLEQSWQREGLEVRRLDGAADFCIVRNGREALVGACRWKAANTGVEPLRALHEAAQRLEAQETLWLTIGGLSEAAYQFAAQHRIRIVDTAGLVKMLPATGRKG